MAGSEHEGEAQPAGKGPVGGRWSGGTGVRGAEVAGGERSGARWRPPAASARGEDWQGWVGARDGIKEKDRKETDKVEWIK